MAASVSERLDRKWTIVLFLCASIPCALWLGLATSRWEILVAAVALSFCVNGVPGPLYAYTTEVYPTAARATGMGMASAMARVGAIAAPVAIGYLYAAIGFSGVFTILSGVLLLGTVAIAVFGLRTAGRSLEELHAVQERASHGPVCANVSHGS